MESVCHQNEMMIHKNDLAHGENQHVHSAVMSEVCVCVCVCASDVQNTGT
jgi:hypothetical protein